MDTSTKKQKFKEINTQLNRALFLLDQEYIYQFKKEEHQGRVFSVEEKQEFEEVLLGYISSGRMMDKCKECPDGEMVLKIEDEEFQYRGIPLVVPSPYHECNSCGFDIVSYDLSVLNDALVQHAKTKVYNDE